jgi:hypothetical protein
MVLLARRGWELPKHHAMPDQGPEAQKGTSCLSHTSSRRHFPLFPFHLHPLDLNSQPTILSAWPPFDSLPSAPEPHLPPFALQFGRLHQVYSDLGASLSCSNASIDKGASPGFFLLPPQPSARHRERESARAHETDPRPASTTQPPPPPKKSYVTSFFDIQISQQPSPR